MIIGINNSEEMHQKIMSGEMYGTIDNKMEDQVMEICRLMQAILKRIQDHIRKCGIVRRRQSLKRKEQNESKRKEELKK